MSFRYLSSSTPHVFVFLQIKHCSKLNQQTSKKKDHLYIIRAKELANHYLGFNGWSTEIINVSLE
jgi:recombination DNA repair RAD52 pathway protein